LEVRRLHGGGPVVPRLTFYLPKAGDSRRRVARSTK
jgi:hypothetical protein